MMGNISRRHFLSAAGLMGAAGAMGAMAGCAPRMAGAEENPLPNTTLPEGEEVVLSDGTVWKGTPPEIAALGASTMPLEELNRRRKAYVDSQTEFVADDGTVVPAPYVKMRALIHTHGFGCGEGLNKEMFVRMMDTFTEEQAEAYLDMPWGKDFTVNEYYHKCQQEGIERTYEECKELCEFFSANTYLPFRTTNEGRAYNIPGFAEGVNTYTYCDEYYADPESFVWPLLGSAGLAEDHALSGTPVFMSVPLNKEVVSEESEMLAYDDFDQVIRDHEYIAVQPCSCRYEAYVFQCHENGESFPTFKDFCSGEFSDYRDNNGDRIETCLALGDDAEYLVSLGLGRRITQEEALEIVQKSRDEGCILHCLYGKEHAWACMCNPKVCGITAQWEAGATVLGGWEELQEQSIAFNHRSHYELEVDFTKCITCGTCAGRCPMQAITMDGMGGSPQVTDHLCQRCGQCAYVCSQKARKLAKRPDDEIAPLPHLLEDDYNLKAAWRFEHNLIGRDDAATSESHF